MHFRTFAWRFIATISFLVILATSADAHEAWLLTPSEIEELSVAPIPPLFRSRLFLGIAATMGFAVSLFALRLEASITQLEDRLIAPFSRGFADVAPLFLRLGLASMLLLAAFGGLPRHGTSMWTTPTFLVPDMQLVGIALAGALTLVQLIVGFLLLLGLLTRICGAALVGFSMLGLAVFGSAFGSYGLHFAGPGLIVIALGGGRFSLDQAFHSDLGQKVAFRSRKFLWRGAQILIGIGFVYLGIAYKLLQPTLLIAILEHGEMPTFGLPMPVVALVMTGVEILCGALLVLGRLVRPVALAILGAITFLAVVLGETPLFHANLYGALLAMLLIGRHLPLPFGSVQFRRVRVA
ncbi:MAG: hypothetical protein AAGG57_19890 [Pseudomonadota bacterium]